MIDKRIIFENDNGGISILIPSPQWQGTIEELANKDVPKSTPYLIVNATDIPKDREFRDAWEADFSNPDGYGGQQ